MSTGFDRFDTMSQKAVTWLDEIKDDMGAVDRHEAYEALRAVIRTLRDRLPMEEAVDLSAELPALIRGIYFSSYKPSQTPTKERSPEEFYATVQKWLEMEDADENVDAQRAVESVFRVMAGHLASGQIEQLVNMFPEDMRSLWPSSFVESAN